MYADDPYRGSQSAAGATAQADAAGKPRRHDRMQTGLAHLLCQQRGATQRRGERLSWRQALRCRPTPGRTVSTDGKSNSFPGGSALRCYPSQRRSASTYGRSNSKSGMILPVNYIRAVIVQFAQSAYVQKATRSIASRDLSPGRSAFPGGMLCTATHPNDALRPRIADPILNLRRTFQ